MDERREFDARNGTNKNSTTEEKNTHYFFIAYFCPTINSTNGVCYHTKAFKRTNSIFFGNKSINI